MGEKAKRSYRKDQTRRATKISKRNREVEKGL
jgi:hypothetical protein